MTFPSSWPAERLIGDRYRFERKLGEGGMADVFVARDLRHHREVAVKVLKPELSSALATERFLREIEITAHLSHPHVLPVFDSGEIDGLPYYVMPLVRGETLKQRLARERQLPLEDAIRIATEVAEALAHAHAHGVVHRDVKPDNILLEDSHVRVADFGVASAVSAAAGGRLTATGVAVGTPMYMSPEQAAGDERVDARTDVYALGCVLYEMLGGEPPFVGTSAQAIMARKATQDAPSLRVLRGTVTPALERLVRKALARSPADRFGSAEAFAHALRHHASVTGELSHARRVATFGRGSAIAAVALAVIALGVSISARQRNTRARRYDLTTIRRIAVMPMDADSTDTTLLGDIHARLIDEMSHIGALHVTGEYSSLQVHSTNQTIPAIAKRLNVQALVLGSARGMGDSVHIHVRLLDGAHGDQLWAREFVGGTRHLALLQKEVTREIASFLMIPLSAEDRARLTRYRAIDPRANEAYRKGVRLQGAFDPDRLRKSIAAFEEAIRLDPEDPAPHVALAVTYASMGLGHDTIPAATAFQLAKESAQRALQLDPQSAEAHAVMANIHHLWDWDWAAAGREFELAIKLNPGNAFAHHRYGVYLRTLVSPDSAIAELERARKIDPLQTVSLSDLAAAYVWAGRPDSAIRWAREGVDLDPSFAPGRWAMGLAFMMKGQHDSSIAEHRRAVDLNPQFRAHLAQAYAAAGHFAEFDRLVGEMSDRDKRRLSLVLAEAWALRGNRDSTFHWVDVALADHFPWIDNIVGPGFRSVASDPRYRTVLRKLALSAR